MDRRRLNASASKAWVAAILIGISAAIIYSNIYHAPFVFDDKWHFIETRAFKDLNRHLALDQLMQPRGLVNLTFALNYRIGKLDVFGYHLINPSPGDPKDDVPVPWRSSHSPHFICLSFGFYYRIYLVSSFRTCSQSRTGRIEVLNVRMTKEAPHVASSGRLQDPLILGAFL